MLDSNDAFGQNLPVADTHFNRYGTEEGLSQNNVQVTMQDSRGFLWIGAGSGLNRFDGYRFEIFEHRRDDPTSLSNSSIWALHEDDSGHIWIGSEGGLDRLDPATRQVERIAITDGESHWTH